MKTLDITPTWSALVVPLLDLLQSKSSSFYVRYCAGIELQRIGATDKDIEDLTSKYISEPDRKAVREKVIALALEADVENAESKSNE